MRFRTNDTVLNKQGLMGIRWRLSKIIQVDDSDGDSAKLGMISVSIWHSTGHVFNTCWSGGQFGELFAPLKRESGIGGMGVNGVFSERCSGSWGLRRRMWRRSCHDEQLGSGLKSGLSKPSLLWKTTGLVDSRILVLEPVELRLGLFHYHLSPHNISLEAQFFIDRTYSADLACWLSFQVSGPVGAQHGRD